MKDKKAFTPIELLVVVAFIGILEKKPSYFVF